MKKVQIFSNRIARLAAMAAGLAVSLLSVNANAQDFPTSGFGIKGGVNFSNYYSGDVTDKNPRTGFNAGIYGRFVINEGIAIQPELLYTTRGTTGTYNNFVTGGGKATFKTDYIQLPVLLSVNILPFLNIHAGPYAAYLVSVKTTNGNENNVFNFEDNVNKDNFQAFDFGVSGGIGVDVQKFHAGARYDYGLQKVGKDKSVAGLVNYNTLNAKNSAISLYVAIDLFNAE
jgi:hypothetical protein